LLRVRVQKTTNHALVLRIVFSRLALEKFDASLAQCESDLDSLISKSEILGGRKKVGNNRGVAHGLSRVFYFRAHRSVSLSANIRRQISERHRRDR